MPLRAAAVLAVVSQTPSPPLAATNWKIDPARKHIAFVIDAVDFARTEGRFQRFEGRISVDFTGAEGRVARCKWARTCRAFSMGNIDP